MKINIEGCPRFRAEKGAPGSAPKSVFSFSVLTWEILCLLFFSLCLQAQTGGAPAPKPPAAGSGKNSSTTGQTAAKLWSRHCVKTAGFCFEYPVKWTNLGPIYEGSGVVVAEPAPSRPQQDWNQITATALELPEPAAGTQRPELNDLIDHLLTPSPGTQIHTTQRRNAVVGGYPAQVVTTEIQEEGKPPATEMIAFIDADGVIYSMALRCAPPDLKRLQPVFDHLLKSWRETPVQ